MQIEKITIHSDNVKVIHRYDVSNAVRSFQRENTEICMNDEDIKKYINYCIHILR